MSEMHLQLSAMHRRKIVDSTLQTYSQYEMKHQHLLSVLLEREREVRSYVAASLPCEGPAALSCTAVSSSLAPSGVSLLLLSLHPPDAECGHLGPARGTKSMQNDFFLSLFIYSCVCVTGW